MRPVKLFAYKVEARGPQRRLEWLIEYGALDEERRESCDSAHFSSENHRKVLLIFHGVSRKLPVDCHATTLELQLVAHTVWQDNVVTCCALHFDLSHFVRNGILIFFDSLLFIQRLGCHRAEASNSS